MNIALAAVALHGIWVAFGVTALASSLSVAPGPGMLAWLLLCFGTMRFPLPLLLCLVACSDPEIVVQPPVGERLDTFDGLVLPFEFAGDIPTQHVVTKTRPVRNQGSRDTCNTFASIGLLEELMERETGRPADFSEQYLQWLLKAEGFDPWPDHQTSNPFFALSALHEHGVPSEAFWPYSPACAGDPQSPLCITGGTPPEEPQTFARLPEAPRWLRTSDIKAYMTATDLPVLLKVDWRWQSWSHAESHLPVHGDYAGRGWIPYPSIADQEQSEDRPGAHTVLIVGWDDQVALPGLDADGNATGPVETRAFLIRNSWGGDGWGRDNSFAPGYGWISERYVHELGFAISLQVD